MAKRTKRRRPTSRPAPARQATADTRRERKQERREAAARAAKAETRRAAYRRAVIGGLVGLLAFAGISWFTRVPSPTPLSPAALAAAERGGCDPLEQPTAEPVRTHLADDERYDYPDHPATSGPHDQRPLDDQPRVYTDPAGFQERRAVHSLEHGAVIMYFRPPGDRDGLPQPVVDALAPIAQRSPATYLIPYPDLPSGTALAYTAWNQLLTCPAGIAAADASALADGFVTSFTCTSNAPEGRNGPGC